MQWLKDLGRAIKRSPRKAAAITFTKFSVVFTAIKIITFLIPTIKIENGTQTAIIALIALVWSLKSIHKPSQVNLQIANSNTCLDILFGDLFEQDGLRLISVNEYFDSSIGKPVSDNSLHGIFIDKCFGGHPESLDATLTSELKNITYKTTEKADGKNKSYPIGTTAIVTVEDDRYLLFALAKSDIKTCKASADVTQMWKALDGAWTRARNEAGGDPVNLPLIGTGLSGIGLPTRDVLNLLILSAITETKEKEVTRKIRIVLHRDRFDDVDLQEVRKYWSEK